MMMAQQERLSQLLPSVKCSTCLKPVPLSDLVEHICVAPPPLPAIQRTMTSSPAPRTSSPPGDPRSALSTTTATSFNHSQQQDRPPRSRGLPSSPASSRPSSRAPTQPIVLGSDLPFPRRPSVPNNNNTPPPGPPTLPIPYLRRPPGFGGSSLNSVPGPVPKLVVPPPPMPPQRMATFPPVRPPDEVRPREAFVPVDERGIVTISGGEAGMAGVGRRGFAAAARAAMFYPPVVRPIGPQPQPQYNRRRPDVPQILDLDTAAARPSDTPPLSAGSGYTSHSPGPTSPLQQPEFAAMQQRPSARIHRTPSPSGPTPQILPTTTPTTAKGLLPTKPVPTLAIPHPAVHSNPNTAVPSSPRLPFFEKLKNKAAEGIHSDNSPPRLGALTGDNDASSKGGRGQLAPPSIPVLPTSANSEIEYRLAYAETESSEEEQRGRKLISSPLPQQQPALSSSLPSPPQSDLAQSILRSLSHNSRVQFGSVSERSRSRSNDSRFSSSKRLTLRASRSTHSRNNSEMSSYSSNADSSDHVFPTPVPESGSGSGSGSSLQQQQQQTHTRDRSNSSAIAQALGLSQTPPSEYRKLGGPGIYRIGRSASGSSGARSAYSRSAAGSDDMSRTPSSVSRKGSVDEEDQVLNLAEGMTVKAQRSNTVQAAPSPEVRLPMRARSERESGGVQRKDKPRKPRVCLKCLKSVEDGRWVSSDGGSGVLCERCWKNLYLPKCRRCNLPIEKQAVSSSDGQLKGKYHKDCFNCHTCHKPFPDKTFYVYDGKPFCAYHYHEANDSLCAAALCGQPIEGPCAVSHVGDRYHPEHMTCEYPDGDGCRERLSEYWEVEGRMLCERHAVMRNEGRGGNGGDEGEEDEDEVRWQKRKRGLKRVTRFIDLAGGAGAGVSPGS